MEFDARKEIKLIIEKWLKDTLKKSDIKENDNLIEKGLSSMQVMQLSGILKKEGLRISFAKLIEKPTLNSWFDLVANSKLLRNIQKIIRNQMIAKIHLFLQMFNILIL